MDGTRSSIYITPLEPRPQTNTGKRVQFPVIIVKTRQVATTIASPTAFPFGGLTKSGNTISGDKCAGPPNGSLVFGWLDTAAFPAKEIHFRSWKLCPHRADASIGTLHERRAGRIPCPVPLVSRWCSEALSWACHQATCAGVCCATHLTRCREAIRQPTSHDHPPTVECEVISACNNSALSV